MVVSKHARLLMLGLLAPITIGLVGDAASGARPKPRATADVPAVRVGDWAGVPEGWARAHHRFVDRARRADADVVFLGDSIFQYWGGGESEDRGAESWDAEIAPLKAANFGFAGDQTQNLLHRIQDGELAGRPRVAVVLIGTNNLEAGQSPEETASGVAAVVDAIRAASPRTRVLLLGLLPRGIHADDPIRQDVARVNAILEAWAPRSGVAYLDAGSDLIHPDGTLRTEILWDAIHPASDGYKAMASAIRGPLRELLGRG